VDLVNCAAHPPRQPGLSARLDATSRFAGRRFAPQGVGEPFSLPFPFSGASGFCPSGARFA
jgi:hypothetical protein